MTTLKGTLQGTEQCSEYWADVQLPVIRVDAPKPIFYESGYASGHANEKLAVPGLLALLKQFQGTSERQNCHTHYWQTENFSGGHAWAHVQWSNGKSSVFLSHVYDKATDVYSMSN